MLATRLRGEEYNGGGGISLESCPDGILPIQISNRLCASNSSPRFMLKNKRGGFMMGGFQIC